jgi:hypothetical protein
MRLYELRQRVPLLIALSICAVLSVLTLDFFAPLEKASFHELWMRGFMVYFFAGFGLLKLLNLNTFVKSFKRYDWLARQWPGFAYCFPWIELGLAFMYACNIYLTWACLITFLVSMELALSIECFLRKKERSSCACMGSGIFQVPLSYLSLLENIAMAAMALLMLF